MGNLKVRKGLAAGLPPLGHRGRALSAIAGYTRFLGRRALIRCCCVTFCYFGDYAMTMAKNAIALFNADELMA